MGQIIDLELMRIVHQEKIRTKALNRFPWADMMKTTRELVEPMTHFWSEQKRTILLELVYRTAYEAFVWGILEAKRAREHLRASNEEQTLEDLYRRLYQGDGERLVYQLIQEFSLFGWLDEWSCESVLILLEDLVRRWFVRGARQKWR
ncbi:hypothetical protein [Lihuaxuella thermophila]|uniref:Uncharacterized protein n=1 Tax=Lihuaxuella thermophila TaxID=1173111 RepID=A0A1H8I123_9BACL|nr:hypothetical protein [Lihuaxuella thermophila]SEN61618.1 hypothetical protein SAMN05444955_115118 [Lihuaxuella thermophila]